MSGQLETVGPRSGAAPLTYRLTELGTVDLQSAFAVFDGSGASGSFRPSLALRAQNGALLARGFPTDELAAGDTAAVTFAPFLRSAGGGSGGSGIQFDTTPQVGGFLEVTTNSGSPGMSFQDETGNGIYLNSEDGDDGFLGFTTGGLGSVTIGTGSVVMTVSEHVEIQNGIGAQCAHFNADDKFYLFRLAAAASYGLEVRDSSSVVLFSVTGAGNIYTRLHSGGTLTVSDSGNNPIFQVDEDGDLHGKTGKALTFDL